MHNIIADIRETRHLIAVFCTTNMKTSVTLLLCMQTSAAHAPASMKAFTIVLVKSNNFPWIAFQQEPEFYKVCGTPQGGFAAARMKAERFQNSTTNKSHRERKRDTFAGPLLLGYNM